MPDSDVRILLSYMKWNKEKLLLKLTSEVETRNEILANANSFGDSPIRKPMTLPDACELCPSSNHATSKQVQPNDVIY